MIKKINDWYRLCKLNRMFKRFEKHLLKLYKEK